MRTRTHACASVVAVLIHNRTSTVADGYASPLVFLARARQSPRDLLYPQCLYGSHQSHASRHVCACVTLLSPRNDRRPMRGNSRSAIELEFEATHVCYTHCNCKLLQYARWRAGTEQCTTHTARTVLGQQLHLYTSTCTGEVWVMHFAFKNLPAFFGVWLELSRVLAFCERK